MKIRYVNETEFLVCTKNVIYDVLDTKHFRNSVWYKIIDDSGSSYWYPAHFFEIVT